MPTSDALMGLGMPPHQAEQLGGNPQVANGTGTSQTGAGKILTKNVELNTSGGQTAVILPSDAPIMTPYYIFNPDATTGLVFVPSGDTLAGTLNGSVSVAQNKAAIIWQYKKDNWAYVLLA